MHGDFADLGCLVRHVMNPAIVGVVIGYEGSLVLVRLASMQVIKLHEYELTAAGDDGEGEPALVDEDDNVIDFTKARDLRTAKTRGAA
ncbi:hypothetical protein ACFPOD_05095 [Nitratireductor kimnyeongensis]|uniref:Uncharacterized protein n=1 Tax=Nitratireductor kimnyeongensis TaxID=430679 RepID=A0ABW0T526_9HYPH|nr:hypothetical protein [Nitratireductor kimnyeongensis]QZZ34541.1 hypothetical protein KW403_12105 [Nitratireductor kimnyeongensis]